MSTSFPFMAVARMRGLPYSLVLRVADYIEKGTFLSNVEIDSVGLNDWKWIQDTVRTEQRRRKENQK